MPRQAGFHRRVRFSLPFSSLPVSHLFFPTCSEQGSEPQDKRKPPSHGATKHAPHLKMHRETKCLPFSVAGWEKKIPKAFCTPSLERRMHFYSRSLLCFM